MRFTALTFCFLLFASSAHAQQPSAAKATVQGVVKNARTGEAMMGARVTLTEFGRSPSLPGRPTPALVAVTTDRNGEFVLSDVDAGTYAFSVGSSGFTRYDNPRLVLAAGQIVKDLVVRMSPTGNVSGRVSNANGKPAVGVTVNLVRRTFGPLGVPNFSNVTSAETNDLGEYRMFWVTPGRYYVTTAEPRSGDSSGGNDERYRLQEALQKGLNGAVSENYSQVYYPGVSEIDKASLIEIQEGSDLRGIDLTVSRQQRFNVRGRIIDTSTGQPPAKVSISLSQRSATGVVTGSFGARNYDPATGFFDLRDLPPGSYGVGASTGERTFIGIPPAGTPFAFAALKVRDSNIDDLVLRLGPSPSITGQIRVEGQLPSGTTLERLRISLSPVVTLLMGNPSVGSSADGTFAISALPEGTARVTVSPLPAGFYIKEARFDGADVLTAPSTFSVSGKLEITISGNAGQLDGRVIDSQMRPVSSVEAVLIPDSRNRTELVKRATTNQEGRFSIAGIPPGDYKVFAWERLEANSFFDEQVLSKFEQKGTAVRITEASKATAEVTIIPEVATP